jgi:hypothetical protein
MMNLPTVMPSQNPVAVYPAVEGDAPRTYTVSIDGMDMEVT